MEICFRTGRWAHRHHGARRGGLGSRHPVCDQLGLASGVERVGAFKAAPRRTPAASRLVPVMNEAGSERRNGHQCPGSR